MADANTEGVKDVERIEVTPAAPGAENVDGTGNQPDSPQDENAAGSAEPEAKPDGEGEPENNDNPPAADGATPPDSGEPDAPSLKRLPDETPREYAMRLEIGRLKKERRDGLTKGMFGQTPPGPKKELPPEKQAILKKYKPDEINALREVIDVMAEDMGFVRTDQLGATTYQDKATEELDKFLEKHPEYLPENDKENVLWTRFQQEFALYARPQNPKEFTKIFQRVHKEVFGIQPAAALKPNAQRAKTQVASHAGASRPGPNDQGVRRAAPVTGIRTDMLKGFSAEEKAAIEQRAEG